MAYASQSGRAKTSPRNPRAHAICDRCGFRYNRIDLSFQMDYRGSTLQSLNILVCRPCTDVPNQQRRSIVVPADPMPVINPRVQDFGVADSVRSTSGQNTVDPTTGIPVPGTDQRITQDDDTRVIQQTGAPSGSLNEEPGTDPNVDGPTNPPPGNTSIPNTGPL
jgi:hypothetical protein